MRITLIGQAAFGASVLDALLKREEQVVAVYVPPDTPGNKTDPLKQLAGQQGIPVFQPARMRHPAVYKQYTNSAPDLGVMAFVTDFVPLPVLQYPKMGTIQYHPSLLPRHRGGSAMNWPIMNGEKKTGITIFWPDDGIDTGPILMQKEVEITPGDTLGTLYFNKLFPMGVEALMESIDLVYQGKAPRIPQDETQATYEGLCQEKDAVIDWRKPIADVYNLIRGTNPQPGAITASQMGRLKIFDCEPLARDIRGVPGEVVEISERGMVVAGQGGCLLIKQVQPQSSPNVSASAYAHATGLKAGSKLG